MGTSDAPAQAAAAGGPRTVPSAHGKMWSGCGPAHVRGRRRLSTVVDAPQPAKKTTRRPRFSAFAVLGAPSIAGRTRRAPSIADGARPPAESCVFGIGQMLD